MSETTVDNNVVELPTEETVETENNSNGLIVFGVATLVGAAATVAVIKLKKKIADRRASAAENADVHVITDLEDEASAS